MKNHVKIIGFNTFFFRARRRNSENLRRMGSTLGSIARTARLNQQSHKNKDKLSIKQRDRERGRETKGKKRKKTNRKVEKGTEEEYTICPGSIVTHFIQ